MKSTVHLQWYPRSFVPKEGRADWLDRHGPPPKESSLEVELPLKDWERLGAIIDGDGSVWVPGTTYSLITQVAGRILAETGRVPETVQPELLLEELQRQEKEREKAYQEEKKRTEEVIRAHEKEMEARKRSRELRLKKIAELATLHGDSSVRERIEAGPGPLGLLPEDEAVRIIRDATLPVTEELRPRRRLSPCHAEDCYRDEEDRIEVDEPEEAASVTGEEWERVKKVRDSLSHAGLPQGKIMRRSARCTRCDAVDEVLYLRVSKDLGGGLILHREYEV